MHNNCKATYPWLRLKWNYPEQPTAAMQDFLGLPTSACSSHLIHLRVQPQYQ